MTTLKAVILTLNEAQHIAACVESVAWTDGIIVLDSFSSDATCELARAAGADVLQHTFENYAQQRNVALQEVDADWILFVDADERATPELAAEARVVTTERSERGWWIPRHNIIMGHRMRATGWYPDYQMRLLCRDAVHYDPQRAVHELVILDGDEGYLTSHLIHYNYTTLRQFWAKQRRYLTYDIGVLAAAGTPTRLYTPYSQALRHFWWRFVTLQGWRDTFWGAALSILMATYEFMKYHKLRQRQRSGPQAGA